MEDKKIHVLFVTLPMVGHLLPIVGSIKHYSKKGYRFSVLCERKYSDIFRRVEEIEKIHELPVEFNLDLPPVKYLADYMMYIQLPKYNMAAADKAEQLHKRNDYDIIASDFFMLYSHIIAKKYSLGYWMNFPIVYPFRNGFDRSFRFYPTPINPLYFPLLNKLRKFWFNLLYITFIPYYARKKKVKTGALSQEMIAMEKILLTPPEEFHHCIRKFPPNLEFVPYTPDDTLLFNNGFSPLNNGKKNILISMGTIFNHPKQARRLISSLKLDVGRFNFYFAGSRPPGAGELIYLKNTPLSKILPHMDLFISHGGANSLVLAHKHGIRTIILPQGGDQWENKKCWKERQRGEG